MRLAVPVLATRSPLGIAAKHLIAAKTAQIKLILPVLIYHVYLPDHDGNE